MTLHSAKGLEFDTVFLPGWEEGLFPHQRSLDESGRAGLEEERRLAHVGLTRARKRAKIYFATNRRIHGMWTSTMPSRFLDELPEAHVEVKEAAGGAGGFGMSGYGASRFDEMESFGSNYTTPGWQRAQSAQGARRLYRRRPAALCAGWGVRRRRCRATTARLTRITSPLAGEVARASAARARPKAAFRRQSAKRARRRP